MTNLEPGGEREVPKTVEPLIRAEDISVRYGGTSVLSHVNFQISPADIVTIVGPNGSGKSTMLRVLIGALSANGGKVVRKPGLRIGYVPQRLHMEPTMPLKVSRFFHLPRR
ncbi:MAG: ATP-binding cassette domain-containing protein, partial [Granulosicoccus sp.]